MFRVLAFCGFYIDFILNSGVKWGSLAEEQEVFRAQLAEGKPAPFTLRHCLQQLHHIEYFCVE